MSGKGKGGKHEAPPIGSKVRNDQALAKGGYIGRHERGADALSLDDMISWLELDDDE